MDDKRTHRIKVYDKHYGFIYFTIYGLHRLECEVVRLRTLGYEIYSIN